MKWIAVASCIACTTLSSAEADAQQPPESPAVTVIHAGRVLANPGGTPLDEQTIVITDGTITAVDAGYQPPERYGADANHVDLKDRFVLPGLIDLHKHIAIQLDADPETYTSESRLALSTAAVARAVLEAGVTTIRDAGDNNGVTFAVRDAIEAGVIAGPRILAAGRIVSRTGGHGTDPPAPGELARPRGGCDGPESCRRVVRENVEAGSDWIKISASGSGGAPSGQADAEPIMLPDEFGAAMEAARGADRPVAAHAHSKAAIVLALENGARTIEHGTYFDDECARLFERKGAFLVPTAYVAEFVSTQLEMFSGTPGRLPPEGLKRWTEAAMANPGRAWRAGIRLGVGSDSGSRNDAHATAREIELFVASGVPADEALKAATATGAEILGLEDRIGRIRPGYEADLIAVAGDPLRDVSTLRAVSFVMKGGAIVRDGSD
jgi:imidazolonepropionase-like amidohydrolase